MRSQAELGREPIGSTASAPSAWKNETRVREINEIGLSLCTGRQGAADRGAWDGPDGPIRPLVRTMPEGGREAFRTGDFSKRGPSFRERLIGRFDFAH